MITIIIALFFLAFILWVIYCYLELTYKEPPIQNDIIPIELERRVEEDGKIQDKT